jgi:hypothetical protein
MEPRTDGHDEAAKHPLHQSTTYMTHTCYVASEYDLHKHTCIYERHRESEGESESERERERARASERERVCVCVCERERSFIDNQEVTEGR